jgi:hypothetical protein
MGESFWQNNSMVTHILFELQPIIIFSPVANFGDQSLGLQRVFQHDQPRFLISEFVARCRELDILFEKK